MSFLIDPEPDLSTYIVAPSSLCLPQGPNGRIIPGSGASTPPPPPSLRLPVGVKSQGLGRGQPDVCTTHCHRAGYSVGTVPTVSQDLVHPA